MLSSFQFRASPTRLAIGLIATGCCVGAFAAESTQQKKSDADRAAAAKALVDEALIREIDGDDDERRDLLAEAEALAPDLPAAKWQRGKMLVEGDWVRADEVATASGDSLQAEYLAKRDAAADTIRDQMDLADWCRSNDVPARERAHLARVLTFDPSHAKARARLGYFRIDGEWVSREEISHAFAEQAKAQASLAKFGERFEILARSVHDEKASVRERAVETLRSIREVEAIPALEAFAFGADEETTKPVLEALAGMPEKEAALSLVRFAVFWPSYRVRGWATDSLKGRKFDHFVPELLATMRGSVQTESFFERRQDARLVYRQVFYRETMRQSEAIVEDLVFANSQPSYFAIRDGVTFTGKRLNAQDDAAVAKAAHRAATDLQAFAAMKAGIENANSAEVNGRIGDTLSEVAGEDFGADSNAWWNWWNEYNELHQSQPKQTQVRYSQSWQSAGYEQVPDRPRITDIRQPQNFSCFVAGTPVLTDRGDVAIEQVRVGDLVVAQDVETGELALKPVLATTVRPPAEILRVEHEKGSFRCTGGHPFWVSGEGWVHARRIQSGMELHTLDGSVRVSDVVTDGEEPAYNLIVDDFANYFAGEARILSHDNSSRRPTDAVVPGLMQK